MTEAECRKVLSANIRHYRKRLGLSQLTVALELDISPNFLSDIENEKKWVSPKTLTAIASVLNVNVYELFKPPAAEEPVSDSTYYTLKKMHRGCDKYSKTIHAAVRRIFRKCIL